jgi:hypothetical protein
MISDVTAMADFGVVPDEMELFFRDCMATLTVSKGWAVTVYATPAAMPHAMSTAMDVGDVDGGEDVEASAWVCSRGGGISPPHTTHAPVVVARVRRLVPGLTKKFIIYKSISKNKSRKFRDDFRDTKASGDPLTAARALTHRTDPIARASVGSSGPSQPQPTPPPPDAESHAPHPTRPSIDARDRQRVDITTE